MKYAIIFLLTLAAQQGTFKDLGVDEFRTAMDSLQGEVLLDVRTPDETAKGVIAGATYLDYFRKDFEAEVARLDKDKTYFVYCAAGGRSGETMELMSKLGFKRVYNLKGGFTDWKKMKMPVARQ
jgi:phage shock protein E